MELARANRTEYIIKAISIIVVIGVFAFVVYKYWQFRTALLEKQRIELAREEKKKQEEAEQKAFQERFDRCKTVKTILDVTYKNGLFSANLDCIKTEKALEEISKKIGVKIISPELWSIKSPVSFKDLIIKDGLDLIAKNLSDKDGVVKFRYLSDRNIWSLDKVFLEVKDPPKDGVTHIVETKDSYDFVKADGTNVRSYTAKSGREESKNGKFIVIDEYYSGELIILNNQGEFQWKTKRIRNLRNYQLSNNGQYIVADDRDVMCGSQCHTNSFIVNEQGFTKIEKIGEVSKIEFSKNGDFFVARGNEDSSSAIINEDYFISLFDEKGNQLWTKKRISKLGKEIDFKLLP
ncbi:hypothetical protein HY061_01750 [Candidatus Azambacteria bacterium]|nr:hypothetical protein [Candidatus Azambacteria bacterium]